MDLAAIYYALKPLMPRRFQLALRRRWVRHRLPAFRDTWPIDTSSGEVPAGWPGWPDGKRFAVVLTHDVDTARGQSRCPELMDLEKRAGFRSSFNFVPERYEVSGELRMTLEQNRFEVGVHGLLHDGKLYSDQATFRSRAQRINRYVRDWGAAGFRSPSMQHNLDWLKQLEVEYDASTFDTDPFEPQPDGMGTIFPFWVDGDETGEGYLELPYTLPQDFTLFVLLEEKSIDIWLRKLQWVAERGGMVLLNTHPDYMYFGQGKPGLEEYCVDLYAGLLESIRNRYADQYWQPLPRELAAWCKGSFTGSRPLNPAGGSLPAESPQIS